MFSNLTYKTKFILLAGGTILFIMLAYQLAFKKSIQLYQKNKTIADQLANVQDAPIQINLLKQKNYQLDKIIGKSINLEADLHKQLLEKVSGYCKANSITLREFRELHQVQQQNYLIETSSFVVEGSYIKILKLLKLLETDYKIGKVLSVNFFSERNPKTNQLSLKATIYIQNIKKNKHDE